MKHSFLGVTKLHVKKIAKLEEEKYNMKFDVKPLTKKEYYKMDISEEMKFFTKLRVIMSLSGYTYGNNKNKKAYVFIRDIPVRYGYILTKKEFAECKKNRRISSLKTTLHEIRHLLQMYREELFSKTDILLFDDRLSNRTSLLGGYHDLYSEMDANEYANERLMEISDDEEIKKRCKKSLAAYRYRKNMYDFELFIELYTNLIKNEKERLEVTKPFWDEEGNLRSLKDMMNHEDFDPDDPLTAKILSSNYYLDMLDFDSLAEDEKLFMMSQIDFGIRLLVGSRQENEDMFFEGNITNHQYDYSNKYFNFLIAEKMVYRSNLEEKLSQKNNQNLTKK